MRYRRADIKGATYFFTLNLANRKNTLLTDKVNELRESIRHVKQKHSFDINAIVILPEHLHAIITLPQNDNDFATRWMLIKSRFTRQIPKGERVNVSKTNKGERGIWQRRYWEHMIRDEADYQAHVNYIHYNPVKHGYVEKASQWPHSSIHRYIRNGDVTEDWAHQDDNAENNWGEV